MNRLLLAFMGSLGLGIAFSNDEPTIDQAEARSALEGSTNLWGVSHRAFRVSVEESLAEMKKGGKDACAENSVVWFTSLLALDLDGEAGDVETMSVWFSEKARLLRKYGGLYCGGTNDFRNVWFDCASSWASIRSLARTPSQLLAEDISRGLSNDIQSKGVFFNGQSKAACYDEVAAALEYLVIDVYAKRGIPGLPESDRRQVLSNLVERASLSQDERSALRRSVLGDVDEN